jgi:hypothetical protein
MPCQGVRRAGDRRCSSGTRAARQQRRPPATRSAGRLSRRVGARLCERSAGSHRARAARGRPRGPARRGGGRNTRALASRARHAHGGAPRGGPHSLEAALPPLRSTIRRAGSTLGRAPASGQARCSPGRRGPYSRCPCPGEAREALRSPPDPRAAPGAWGGRPQPAATQLSPAEAPSVQGPDRWLFTPISTNWTPPRTPRAQQRVEQGGAAPPRPSAGPPPAAAKG